MKWRNEQIYHLRQELTLTKEMQDKYFKEVMVEKHEETPIKIDLNKYKTTPAVVEPAKKEVSEKELARQQI